MSGIEVVLIVGAGILITKKVKQHRREKKLKELADAGLLPEQHAPAQVVGQQRNQAEDETLPLYSPPMKEYTSGQLPSYDEVRKQTPQSSDNLQAISQSRPEHQPQTQSQAQSVPVAEKKSSRKWKLWNRDKDIDRTAPQQNSHERSIPVTTS